MAVYVDDARIPYGRMLMCHMVADSIDELNAMASKIGVSRKHIQTGGTVVHYDICVAKRKLAVQYGAVEIDRHTLARKMREWRCIE